MICHPTHLYIHGKTKSPWVRIHVDYVGPFLFILITDSYSKWIEVFPVEAPSSKMTIRYLRRCFVTHGLPQIFVTENASCFTSEKFAIFMRCNNICHIMSVPYHPVTNGCTGRSVCTFKNAMKELKNSPIHKALDPFLFNYGITLHFVTGLSPAKLLMNQKLNSKNSETLLCYIS